MSIVVRPYSSSVLDKSHHVLSHAPGAVPVGSLACVGDIIDCVQDDNFLRGHGTQLVQGQLLATTCGVVVQVNQLIYVQPIKSRYMPEVGDVVIGRVTEIAGKRWKVHLNSRQEAGLQLSAVNLPGGVQRRRTADDELNMRTVFREGDLISAEVQARHNDGSVALHTRSNKYGKLVGGQLLTVPAVLVKRQKQHFHVLEQAGVDVILGHNGLLWIAPHVEHPDTSKSEDLADIQPCHVPLTREQHQNAACVAQSIRALARLYLSIYPASIMDTYQASLEQSVALKDMLEAPFLEIVLEGEVARRRADQA